MPSTTVQTNIASGARVAAPAAGNTAWAVRLRPLLAGESLMLYVKSIEVVLATAVATELALYAEVAAQPFGTLNLQQLPFRHGPERDINNTGSNSIFSIIRSWTVQPVWSKQPLRRTILPATIGASCKWTFGDRGLVLGTDNPFVAQAGIVNVGAGIGGELIVNLEAGTAV